MRSRLRQSFNTPLEYLVPRMFLLPDRTTPLGLVVGGPPAQQRVLGAAAPGGAKQEVQVAAFLESRGWTVAFCVEATPALWAAAADMGLLEEGGDALTLQRRWPFQPSGLLIQEIGGVEEHLARGRLAALHRCPAAAAAASGAKPAGESGSVRYSCGAEADRPAAGAPFAAVQQPLGAVNAPQHLTFRVLDVGCGSGRDLAWLSTRDARVVLHHSDLVNGVDSGGGASASCGAEAGSGDGADVAGAGTEAEVRVSWECVGLDSWHGALQRAAEVLALGAVPAGPGAGGAAQPPAPGGVTLHLVQIEPGTGSLKPLSLPPVSRKSQQREQLVHYLGWHQRQEEKEEEGNGAVRSAGAGGGSAPEGEAQATAPSGGASAHAAGASDVAFNGQHRAPAAEPLELEGRFDLVVCVRFLERAFMGQMAAALKPGGFILFSTFVDGPGLRAFGRPQGREHVLQPDELARTYFGPDQGFQVLRDEIGRTADDREVSLFCACKL